MMDIIHESGWGAWASLLITLLGLVATFTIGRMRGRPGTVAAAFAVAILASGQLGVGTGQRKVDWYVQTQVAKEDLAKKIEVLSVGTREASANLLLSGGCAMLVSIVGGVMALVALRKKSSEA